jgi:pimeloyl-ACP methyl ester carboxylesterase
MPLLHTGSGDIDYHAYGSGEPVTVFAHGLSGSIDETRPLASGVGGTRVFLHFRGHGETTAPDGAWSYADLAAELLAVADHVGATRVLGASMGAGAILSILAENPDRFERVVLFLPAVIDTIPADAPVERLEWLASAIESGDVDRLTQLLIADQADGVRSMPAVADYMCARAAMLVGTDVSRAVRTIPLTVPIADRKLLARVDAPVLIVGQEGDPVHRASVARELAAALPTAQLHVFTEQGAVWLARDALRDLVAGFLNAR